MQQLSRTWKGFMAASLLAWTAACGGTSQDASQGEGQGSNLTKAASAPGLPPANIAGSSLQRQAQVLASANPLAPIITESGFISLSVDGLGTKATSGVVQVNKPAGATVKAAYLAAASTGFAKYQIPNGGVAIDGQSVTWSRAIPSSINSYNYWADVTSLVSSKINAAPTGRVNFSIAESNTDLVDGEILAVIFNDPSATTVNTVILLFGAQSTTGDLFRIGLAEPINKSDPHLGLDLSLGISFGYQGRPDKPDDLPQMSLIDVNGQRMTSIAGGQDDGAPEDGALLTVGGLDDTNANPPPLTTTEDPRADDELYDLRPFVANGATQISIFTQNPSNNDNLFFGALSLTSAAAVIGEGIVLGPTTSSGRVGSTHTVTATLQDSNGQPLANRTVTFQVKTGPNAGLTGTAVSNSLGKATFTYTGNGGAGRDELVASFVMANGQTGTSNSAYRDWTVNHAPNASCTNVVLGADLTCGASGSIDNGSWDPDEDEINCTQSPAGPFDLGTTTVTLTCTDSQGASASCTGTVTVQDALLPTLLLNGPDSVTLACGDTYVDPGATATDACSGDLTGSISTSGSVNTHVPGQYEITYSVKDGAGNATSVLRDVAVVGPCATTTCIPVHLNDYNLFLEGDYTGGHDVVGKVAAGGNISMTDFAVGSGLPASDTANVLVAGGNLSLARGAIYGDAVHGGSYSADQTVTHPRGSTSQGTPIDFAARFAELRTLSGQLAGLAVNGTTTRESWGGVMLHGTDPSVNVFGVQASALTGAVLFNIDAPAGSLAVVNISGASASFAGFGIQFSGGIDQHGVIYNFVDATSIDAHGFGFWGTVLAPNANISFTEGSFDGGLYARSLTGNAEGHINPLNDHSICPPDAQN